MPDARPLRADARRNRERVLDAARAAFAAEGLSVPLDEIARQAGVGPGTLYRHFPTKESLIEAVVHDRLQRLASEGAALRDAPDPGAAFFAFLDRLAAEAGPKRDLFDALASAGVEVGPAVTSATGDLRAQIACLLARAQRAGAVRPDIGSAELRALLSGLLFSMRSLPDTSQALVLSVFRDGLRRQTCPQETRPVCMPCQPGNSAPELKGRGDPSPRNTSGLSGCLVSGLGRGDDEAFPASDDGDRPGEPGRRAGGAEGRGAGLGGIAWEHADGGALEEGAGHGSGDADCDGARGGGGVGVAG